ncbi:MAG: lipid-A-disaccharide synthase [Crocinitomicaceae bacterium]|jgi:lipid-A-disaccharide synthase|nr:lipid-A-disaccharide synthase [Crocinitomicaceae bacterium]MDG1036215.1 lipid-A-disaccharide synthase [Crocinitomicaceae bacterium]MDG1742499.1 lipid-A-disaccharide synthase [Crocinitomicaceae bacterium]
MAAKHKFYIIAGEPSGDLHASNLMQAILDERSNTDFRFWGGEKMNAIQKGMAKHIKDLAFMGFLEVVLNLRTILRNISFCKKDILAYQPDALILVDYPGFNLRIAKWAKKHDIKVYYYISPQIWAWKQNRVYKIKELVDKMYVILPFEKDFYKRFDFDVEYVGHPLLDEIAKFDFSDSRLSFLDRNQLDNRAIIAVLPGSRKQEVSVKLPIMLAAVKGYVNHQIIVAGAPTLSKEFYASIDDSVSVIFNETYEIMANARAAIVTSGTATLEAALFKVPEVICYKGSNISYSIAKRLIKVKYISLVNLILDQEVVKELIQHECTSENIQLELDKIINDENYRQMLIDKYNELEEMLGGGGASKKVAQSLFKTLSKTTK